MPNYCPECGKELISPNAEICPHCGVRLKEIVINRRSPVLAAILSFFISGLGQIYNGQFGKGIAYFIIYMFCFLSLFFLIGFLLIPLWWLIGIVDAYVSATRINAGEDASKFINT
ncbi:zinc-ribbon domain-containing protein [Methanoculleus sp. Afa-1]|jgi:TM2 domain-containing membrane protein YozV|uniref:Zinc-ribbon domain-containing protein n=1 Tax=Methanoculleus formosensis TaxID=2590886 RepID=A0A9E4ZM35_9EURY|nr:zinc ribbon domain-containing protein [Methanoculleus sp. Afa-1]MCT8337644.1 zinc-ribbon domain-containing protein [Methanoculleus sp. Afa-1]